MSPVEADIAGGLSADTFHRFAQMITRDLGIKMPTSKLPLVQSRLLRRVRELGLASLEEYCRFLLESPQRDEERIHFINAITTNKTDFFREPAHFEFLTRSALPSLGYGAAPQPRGRIAAWSAGCSSGEEPYTLAMVLDQYTASQPGLDFAVLATDVSTKVLDMARSAIYQESQIEPVPRGLRARYLLRSREKAHQLVRVVPDLRRRISFHRLNFMDPDYAIGDLFDVIFFRNVMIYFDRPVQEMVVNRLCRNLLPGGYLFVGHSESLAGLDVPVTPIAPSILRKEV